MGSCFGKLFRRKLDPPRTEEDEGTPSFLIDEKSLDFLVPIEEGSFGPIRKAVIRKKNSGNELKVIVKKPFPIQDTQKLKRIINEKNVLCELKPHPNIVALLGLVPHKNMIILEYVDGGNLGKYLRSHLDIFVDQIVYSSRSSREYVNRRGPPRKTDNFKRCEMKDDLESLCTMDLMIFAWQIANGMKYLASVKCVHRDLNLENIYITNQKMIRIGNFELARKIETNGYYRISTQESSLKLLWMAPETYRNNTSNEKSDVWSFAVCLHEIFSLGEVPDPGVRIEDLQVFLKSGGRLNEPIYCPPRIYNFMQWCWKLDPKNRPTFSECFDFFCTNLNNYDIHMLGKLEKKLKLNSENQENIKNWARGRLA